MTTSLKTNHQFKKSSFSPFAKADDPRCVGVSISDTEILVTNTKDRSTILTFSRAEWNAFIKGVKNGEFDLSKP